SSAYAIFLLVTFTEYDRPSGLDFCTGKEKLGLQFRQDLLNQIVSSHGHSSGKQQQIIRQSFFDQSMQTLRFVRGGRQQDRLSASIPCLHSEQIVIGVANLGWAGRHVAVNNLVTGGEYGNSRPFVDLQL